MKILHTSDWHLGHTISGYDRSDEQADMLRQISDLAKMHKPDVLLISGDVYHTGQPSAAVQTLLTETLSRLRRECPEMTIVSIAGNHDSASKHDIFRTPWRSLGVYTFGCIDRDNPGTHIVEIADKGFVVALPYTHPRNMPDDFMGKLQKAIEDRNTNNLPVVLMAHTTVSGCDFTGHDDGTEITVGGIDGMALKELGEGYDYVALGHIHAPQTLKGSANRARYSGSPLAVSFAEEYAHTVTIVNITERGTLPIISTEEITPLRSLVTLPSNGYADWENACRLLKEFPDRQEAYLRLNISASSHIPADAALQATMLCKDKSARFCRLNIERNSSNGKGCERTMTVDELKETSPLELAHRYASDMGIVFTDEMEQMLNSVINMIEQ
ncbi:MAG: exonuclease SbcCD subunit D [Firmicutes bacterium]|nr:exonuclease SbcCD subunit D [Bacillota bacterium]MCM1401241.1 exonuclease SbcCD subunit D [Bacteroides sp.]MCM1477210.1 exonuclease SbcCD subunit D [Bacteroides sp.]